MVLLMKNERGFTLLETLVAFVILSLSLGIILQILSVSTRTNLSVEMHQKAMAVAQNQLELEIARLELTDGEERGEFEDHMSWRSEVQRYEFPDPEGRVNDQIQAYLIEVIVSWGNTEEQSLRLSTIRLQRQ